MKPLLLLSLHAVAPQHLLRLRRAEAVLQALGVHKVLYLFVPNYQGRFPAAEHPDFLAWCRSRRDFTVQWGLHGFFYQDSPRSPGQHKPGAGIERWRTRLSFAEPAEFHGLASDVQAARLDAGLEMFRRCLGIQPAGFVPPGWRSDAALVPLLAERGVPFTETSAGVLRTGDGKVQACRAVAWSAGPAWLRLVGTAAVGTWLRWHKEKPVLRVALHPEDFDRPEVEDAIRLQLREVLRSRVPVAWTDLPAFRSAAKADRPFGALGVQG